MRRRRLLLAAVAMLGSRDAGAGPDAGSTPPVAAAPRAPGTVLTFYGLRQLEQDPNVSDEEKIREWEAFVERATQQIAYARLAAARWRDAGKLRLVAAAREVEEDAARSARERIAQWQTVVEAHPRSEEAAQARKRIAYWEAEETSRLVRDAEGVEAAGRPKVDRIQSWLLVVDWSPASKEAKAADRRVQVLQDQLFSEAESVDRIERLDAATKLEAWQDVLRGRPSAAQRGKAERRVAELRGGTSG